MQPAQPPESTATRTSATTLELDVASTYGDAHEGAGAEEGLMAGSIEASPHFAQQATTGLMEETLSNEPLAYLNDLLAQHACQCDLCELTNQDFKQLLIAFTS